MERRGGRRTAGAITIRDVARHAGVSRMTVSRVVNGEEAVRPETRKLVEEAIGALHYAPNPVARALAGAEQAKVALLHRFPNPGYLGEYLVSMLEEASRLFANLVVRKVTTSREDRAAVRELALRGVQGVVLAPPLADDEELVALIRDEGMAMVATGSTWAQHRLPWVGIDDEAAAKQMTEHLLSLGHRRVGFVTGRRSHASTALRLAGHRAAIEGAGLPWDEALVAGGTYTYRSGLTAAERLLALPDRPTAIFASNDDMAAAVVAAAHRHGLEAPTHLSVCGFDDTTLATTIWPELTTVRQPTAEITRAALELLLRRIAGKGADAPGDDHVLLTHTLVRRQSDGRPPS